MDNNEAIAQTLEKHLYLDDSKLSLHEFGVYCRIQIPQATPEVRGVFADKLLRSMKGSHRAVRWNIMSSMETIIPSLPEEEARLKAYEKVLDTIVEDEEPWVRNFANDVIQESPKYLSRNSKYQLSFKIDTELSNIENKIDVYKHRHESLPKLKKQANRLEREYKSALKSAKAENKFLEKAIKERNEWETKLKEVDEYQITPEDKESTKARIQEIIDTKQEGILQIDRQIKAPLAGLHRDWQYTREDATKWNQALGDKAYFITLQAGLR